MKSSPQGKNWCFTDFNVDGLNFAAYRDLWEEEVVRYLIIGNEVCPDTGRLHFQGFCVFNSNKRLTALKKINAGAHWTLCNGTASQNREYCIKGGDFTEWGDLPATREQRALADKEKWADVIRSAKEGTCEQEYPGEFVRYNTTLKRMNRVKPKDLEEFCGVWYWGPTGTGKSRAARLDFPDYYLKQKTKWWDGYDGEETVLIDDITPSHKFLGEKLLNWCDIYYINAEIKGGNILIRPKRVVVTSNFSIDEVFGVDPDVDMDALRRRFSIVRHFPTRYKRDCDIELPAEECVFVETPDDILERTSEFTDFLHQDKGYRSKYRV